MAPISARHNHPQAFTSSYAPRLRTFANPILTPVIIQQTQIPSRTKRGTTAINYAEDGFDDEDLLEDSEGPRRPTGLRSIRRDETTVDKTGQPAQFGKELTEPVGLQGIWRDWIGRQTKETTEKEAQTQAALPYTPIPIRVDVNLQPFRPQQPLPLPHDWKQRGIDDSQSAYRTPDVTPQYRLKDAFIWNLHEALTTPDSFARQMIEELDLPPDRRQALILEITTQIRQQLEEYAGVALHPLFQPSNPNPTIPFRNIPGFSRTESSTPAPSQSAINGSSVATPIQAPSTSAPGVAPNTVSTDSNANVDELNNPDDAYRCIINLNINLKNQLYSDKFEWSLVHPPGMAEMFAYQTCADLGLDGEWVNAITHGIYEAVLKQKKEACENGGLLAAAGGAEIDNDALDGQIAGWRYEPEHGGDEWGPRVEVLSKEEIEKREGDRERQIRRVRRETARFSSTSNMVMGTPQNDYFAIPDSETPMGRGMRDRKRRRFRSNSPSGRDTPDAGYGGEGGGLKEWERQNWRCAHCKVWGYGVWAVRDGPSGPRTLCHNCGFLYERDKQLPACARDLHRNGIPINRQ